MGALFGKILGMFAGKPNVRILILGLDNAGKTTIIQRLKLGQYIQQVTTTIAFNLERVDVKNLRLEIWDLGGQEQLRPYWRYYYEGTHGVMFVVDSADRDRMDVCASELKAICDEDELRGIPICILANKKDLEGSMTEEEITNRLELSKIKDRPWIIVTGSALSGDGIAEAFEWLSDSVETSLSKH